MKKVPVEKPKRYPYELVVTSLDKSIKELAGKRYRMLIRAYRKIKLMAVVYAYVDFYSHDLADREMSLAWAWEDVEIAFRGYGESALTGAIIQLWTALGENKAKKKKLKSILEAAFAEANAACPLGIERRYLSEYRQKPIVGEAGGFNLPTVLPCRGVRLVEWAEDNDKDPAELAEKFYWFEQADRTLQREELEEVAQNERKAFHLLDGGKE